MTVSELIDALKDLPQDLTVMAAGETAQNKNIAKQEAMKLAIKALEQEPMDVMYYPQVEGITPTVVEPCEDCVSRDAVLEALYDHEYKKDIRKDIEALPSVQPKQRTGRWIKHSDNVGNWWECDQCGTDWGGAVNYCPNCGCAMKGELE